MAKKQSAESVYRVVDVVGVSENSWKLRWRAANDPRSVTTGSS